ncbi:2-carboxy-D-arabinitol-1-phosphatase [Erwinia typographi]|uniref:2-carboxy-D-arabinitol-1-phosphatase n=1 Tax=Erwinia typographi TaxID=371042 RepID=UPI00068DE21A|nr:histidine phosphatase family protein [Erwinia typographi]
MRPITFSTLSLLALTFCLSFPFLTPAKEAVQLSAPPADRQDAVLHFYLVRHGQTWSNIKEMTIGGGGNAQLTPKGRYDANSLGLGLAEIDFIGGYSSTLGRAYETASRVLRGRDLPVVKIEDLKDISWGEAEGGRVGDLTSKFGHSGNDFPFYFGRFDQPEFISPVKAENMAAFSQRFEQALRRIAERHQGQSGNLLVAAHSSMAFYLQKYRPDQPLSGLSNTSVSVLELKNGRFRLLDFNNTDYLKRGFVREKALPPLEITLIVNPLTQLNQIGVVEGTTDSDLTRQGRRASQQMAESLKDSHFLAAWRSELGRSLATAQSVLGEHRLPVTEDKRANEIFLGRWEAEKKATFKAAEPAMADALFSADNTLKFIAQDVGEDGNVAAARLEALLNDIGWQYEYSKGRVAVFTHPLILNAFLNKRLAGVTLTPEKGASIVTLAYKNDGFSLIGSKNFSGEE